MTDIQAIKSKIAKLLRMQESGRRGGSQRCLLVERLCREHGLTSREVSSDSTKQEDALLLWRSQQAPRVRVHDPFTLQRLSRSKYQQRGGGFELCHSGQSDPDRVVHRLSDGHPQDLADRECPKGDRAYRNNFKKGFATVICSRLNQLISSITKIPETNTSALVCTSRDQKQHALADRAANDDVPKAEQRPA